MRLRQCLLAAQAVTVRLCRAVALLCDALATAHSRGIFRVPTGPGGQPHAVAGTVGTASRRRDDVHIIIFRGHIIGILWVASAGEGSRTLVVAIAGASLPVRSCTRCGEGRQTITPHSLSTCTQQWCLLAHTTTTTMLPADAVRTAKLLRAVPALLCAVCGTILTSPAVVCFTARGKRPAAAAHVAALWGSLLPLRDSIVYRLVFSGSSVPLRFRRRRCNTSNYAGSRYSRLTALEWGKLADALAYTNQQQRRPVPSRCIETTVHGALILSSSSLARARMGRREYTCVLTDSTVELYTCTTRVLEF